MDADGKAAIAESTEDKKAPWRRREIGPLWPFGGLMLREESRQIFRPDSDDVDDPDMREIPGRGPLVDGCAADAEQLHDLADGEKLFDWR